MAESFYDILDVSRDASEAAITDAYREAVKETHPDVSDHEDAERRFKLVKRAREVLTDEDERRQYNRLGHKQYVRLNGNPELHDFDDDGNADESSTHAGMDEVQRAAARAASSAADRSGPTNAGATAGWRTQERRWRGNGGPDGWTIGDDPFDRTETDDRTGGGASATDAAEGNQANATTDGGTEASAGAGGPFQADGPTATAGHGPGAGDPFTTGTEARTETATEDGRTGYAVHEVHRDSDQRSVFRTDWSQESPGFFLGSFLLYPVMLVSTVLPGFPIEVNLIIGACTFFMAGYLLTRPGISSIVFGAWSVLLPLFVVWLGVPLLSVLGVTAVVGTWVPFAYAVTIAAVLSRVS